MLTPQDCVNTINLLNRAEIKGYEEASTLVGLINTYRNEAKIAAAQLQAASSKQQKDQDEIKE